MRCDGSETIVIAEDQEGIRVLIKSYLEQHGYTVLSAEDGLQAISLLDHYPRPIHLLVTDLLMPVVDGRAIAKHSLARRPTTQILYISGCSEEAVPDLTAAFLQKPFCMKELGARIRKMLDNSRGSGVKSRDAEPAKP